MRWPFTRTPQPAAPSAPAVDVEGLARAVAQETAAEVLARAQNFPSPLSPVGPAHPIYALNHPWQFYTPQSPERKPGAFITTDQMRALARSYDVLRACIQHLKREVASVPGRISPRDAKDKSKKTEQAIEAAEAFFCADGGLGGVGRRRTHFESETLEDLLVIGAAAVFFSPTRGGGLYEVVAIDAATIRPRVDAYGWPGPGEVAYEQWIEGVQTGPGYTRQQLLYDGLNAVTYTPYFTGPVEWLIQTINAALRADSWNLNWLTNGNTPADIIALPESWTPNQVIEFATYWDGLLAGNSAQRQKARFVPGGTQRVGSPSRKDQDFAEYELWLMRRCCGIMGVAPAAIGFAGEQYKVSQEGSLKSTSQFGAGQILEFRKHLYDLVLQRLGYPFLQWVDVTDEEDDAKTKAETGEVLIRSGQRTPNEMRTADGLDPIEGGDALFVPNTWATVEQAIEPPEAPVDQNPQQPAQDDQVKPSGDDPETEERGAVLRKWQDKALGRLRRKGSAACGFESEAIAPDEKDRIAAALVRCETAEAVRAVFAEVE